MPLEQSAASDCSFIPPQCYAPRRRMNRTFGPRLQLSRRAAEATFRKGTTS